MFDICVDRAALDTRFVEVGDALLDRLFCYPVRLKRELVSYATGFVVATAHLAQHQVFQRRPVYWRRVAAAAQATLITRTLGEGARRQ